MSIYLKTLLLITFLSYGNEIYCQQSINTTGGDISDSGGSVAYTIGQVVYTTHTTAQGSKSKGVQQAYEIYALSIKEPRIELSLDVIPNPTSDYATLRINNFKGEDLSYHLFDIQGKFIKKAVINSAQTQIDLYHLPTATYFLNIVNKYNQYVQTFKLIKH